MVSSEFSEVLTTLLSNLTAHGPLHSTPGLMIPDIKILLLRNMKHQLSEEILTHKALSWTFSDNRATRDAEKRRSVSQEARSHQLFIPGKLSAPLIFQRLGIGVMFMELIIFHGIKTNISQFIVDLAGLKVLLLL